MDKAQHLSIQLEGMERLVDGENGAILFRHPSLRGIPDLVLEGDGYTLEFIGATLLCVDIRNAGGWLRPKGTNRHHHNPIGPAIAISLAADHGALVQGDIDARESATMPPLWLDHGGDPLG